MMFWLAETTFVLAHAAALLLLLLIPALALLKSRSGRQGAVVFSSLHLLHRLGPSTRGRAGGFRLAILFLSLAALSAALARPQWMNRTETISESGVEIMLAIDVSRSMQVEDFQLDGVQVNRLQVAKKVARDFIRNRAHDRIGLMAFAGRPYMASPLTLSKSWLEGEHGLGRVQIGLVEDGTAIGSAIAASAKRLDKRSSEHNSIILLTDGVNNSGQITPLEAARLASTLGIRVYTIAVGTYGDFVVQTPVGPQRLQQAFDEKTLQEIAQISGGKFFHARDTAALETIFTEIDNLEKSEIKSRTVIETDEVFHWFAIPALAFCLLSLVGNETFWRRFP